MVASLNVNPMQTTNASGTFRTLSDGYIQGIAMDDPAIRNALVGGILASSESLPMWGGVGIAEQVAAAFSSTGRQPDLGNTIKRATSVTANAALGLTGFTVFDQAHSMVQTPQSPVPLALSGMSVHLYRLGSGARIPVACAPGLISLRDGTISPQVSWDFSAQKLVPYSPAFGSATISNAVWASTGGGQVTLTVNTDYTTLLDAGDYIFISGVVNTGGVSTSVFNGSFKVKSVTNATTLIVEYLASGSPGTYASGGTIAAGGGALNVKVLDVKASNCMTVNYDTATGYATWNQDGSCALIEI